MSKEDETFNELVEKQESSFQYIKSIKINFGKDSSSRKNLDYLNKRINALEAHWNEFCCNHEILKMFEKTKGDAEYYTKNVYTTTQAIFNETLREMINMKVQLLKDSENSAKGGDNEMTPPDPNFKVEGDDENIKSLTRKQMCNFNAFERAVSKINIDRTHEKWQLQDQLNVLQNKWEAIDKIHWELSYLLEGKNEKYDKLFSYWEKTYDNMKEDISRKIFETSHYEKSTPKIELPEFNGAYNSWVSFRDLFFETIHNNPTLNKTQKMKFLKSKLTGEAEKLIKHLSVSADNYDSCLEIIQHRYDNKRLLFTSFIDTLLNQPTIEKASAASVRRFHDTTRECLNGLQNLHIDIHVWGPLIVHLLASKLDDVTHGDYIKNMHNPRELPDIDEFLDFLEVKFMTLETARTKKCAQKPHNSTFQHKSNYDSKSMNFNKSEKWTKSYHATLRNCPLCKGEHVLRQCATFLDMDVATRNQMASKLNICKNCLYSHDGNKCTSTKRCRNCNYKHHSLLHDDNLKGQTQNRSASSANHVNRDDDEILLTTLQVNVKNKEGSYVILRALLDQGSQVTLITENAAQRLNLPRQKMSASVTGVGTVMGTSKGVVKLECKSIHSDYTFKTDALVMRKLINNLPNSTINKENWKHLDNIKLADPTFNVSGPIDLLLGADIYSQVILEGVLKQDQLSPVAQQTKLGWILCGATKQFNCLVTLNELNDLSHFWETEEVSTEPEHSSNDEFCEDHFIRTTERSDYGRYIVKMPMKPDYEQHLGNSKRQAVAQFLQLEKKMARQEHFAKLYKQFIQDYIDLGHMKPSTRSDTKTQAYLPHHGVLRESSTTTKLRAVFNASIKTDSGFSLNDLMEKGPNLQKDILSLIIKWRSYRYVLTADIEKMYRQILIHQDQQHLQQIIWRESATDPLREMQLCTLTYGTKAAPFLAMRTLLKLAADEGHAYPLAQRALMNDFYMDDVITGHHTIETTKQLQSELYELLKKGGFILRKWASNEQSILTELQEKEKSKNDNFHFKQEEFSKTLGLAWNNKNDTFSFTCETPIHTNEAKSYTKRQLLSEISKIYDPLGWLAPVTVLAKLIFQKLWTEKYHKIAWDETLPTEITKNWTKIKSETPSINLIKIPRWINNYNKTIELQGFCDASEHAYACVVYSRTTSSNGAYVTTLLAAKTKVAPLKNKTTVPRLELCGALLLAKLLEKIIKALEAYDMKISCWTDSKVVLAWLQGNHLKWEKYITNRTKQITSIVPASNWGYVKTNENPADCATRGLTPAKLLNFTLWFEGPEWLKKTEEQEKTSPTIFETKEDLHQNCFTTEPVRNKHGLVLYLLDKYSDIDRVTRILAWVLRFADALRDKQWMSHNRVLKLTEINNAMSFIIKTIQNDCFGNEIQSLSQNGRLPKNSKILKLYPILDNDGVLRVGGRLEHSTLPAETKHPAIIPHEGRLSQLLIEKSHRKTLHGGARVTLAHTRNRYWIVSGNRAVKKILRQCVICRRYSSHKNDQLMGNLPKQRITPSRPFANTGIDFTGHVEVKINKGRGIKTCKGYIAIFICMTTKAVHIELVSDLTTETFIAALKRMCARRGTPKHIYTDNGTNFLGASKVLTDEFKLYKTMLSPEFFKEINDLQIEWHFNAPAWPTAGGLWEAAVRSMKKHLKRVIGQQKLTYEQFSTLLTQIEASMNSRPLCPLSEDIEDLNYLTPGHFLTGGPLLSLPFSEPEERTSVDLRNNWKLIELMNRHYWNRWSQEYLHLLQTRQKWQEAKENIAKGQLVLIKENNFPPSKWAMGRVIELHPGSDDLVRVVTLKTQNGVLKRPITKLAPLPVKEACDVSNTQKQEQQEGKTCNKKNTRTKKSINSLFTLLLVILVTISPGQTTTTTENFKVTQLNENHPVYFDPIGNIQLIHDEWKLLVYFNLTTFWQSTRKVEEFVDHLAKICDTMPNEPCHSTIKQLKFETSQLDEYNKLLLSQHHQRKRRGYVNGIGNLARTLFGVLDDDFAQKYSQDIQKIKSNEQHLLDLIKNQTLIIEAENNIIKKNEEFVNTQFQTIRRYMQETQYEMTEIQNRAQIMTTMNDINAGAITASLLISVLRRTQEMILKALTDIYRGHLDMNLFTPEQLKEQTNFIAGVIPRKLTLPIKNYEDTSNFTNIYKLIYVKARLTEQYLLFELHIPLISDEEYTLYHSIPIRKRVTHNQCKAISITSQYIAINFAKNTYLQFEDVDLQQCTMAMDDNYICHAYKPINNLHSLTASCEAKMLSQNVNITCDWELLRCNDQWIKLHRPNIWLYNCIAECPTRIVCENQVSTTIITMAGLLVLGQDCLIQHKDSTIYSYNVFGSKTKIGIDIEVPTIDSPNDLISTYKAKSITLAELDTSKQHRLIEKQITVQKEHEYLPHKITIHDIGNYTISSFLVGVIAIAILWKFRKNIFKCKKSENAHEKQHKKSLVHIRLEGPHDVGVFAV